MSTPSSGQAGEVVYGVHNPKKIGVIVGPAPLPHQRATALNPGGTTYEPHPWPLNVVVQ